MVSEFHKGRLSRLDVCDAHPELLRAATNVGEETREDCPICEEAKVVLVSYVFGSRLPPSGTCVTSKQELTQAVQGRTGAGAATWSRSAPTAPGTIWLAGSRSAAGPAARRRDLAAGARRTGPGWLVETCEAGPGPAGVRRFPQDAGTRATPARAVVAGADGLFVFALLIFFAIAGAACTSCPGSRFPRPHPQADDLRLRLHREARAGRPSPSRTGSTSPSSRCPRW